MRAAAAMLIGLLLAGCSKCDVPTYRAFGGLIGPSACTESTRR
jgi:hypothetical protein